MRNVPTILVKTNFHSYARRAPLDGNAKIANFNFCDATNYRHRIIPPFKLYGRRFKRRIRNPIAPVNNNGNFAFTVGVAQYSNRGLPKGLRVGRFR